MTHSATARPAPSALDTARAEDAELLLELYRQLVRIRATEEAVIRLRYEQALLGIIHPCAGHEAIAVGVCSVLDERDWVGSYYRSHGHALARGCDLTSVLCELFGRADGPCHGKAGSQHIPDLERHFLGATATVGAGIPHAAGVALANKLRGDGAVAVTFFGDGATGAGVFHETMNIASAQCLPLVLVCENNLWQDHTRTDDVFPTVDLVRYGTGHAMPAVAVDGNDVLAVCDAAASAVARAREGEGPTFLEAKTFLTYYHSQIGVPPDEYRPSEEIAYWAARDPLLRARRRLVEFGVPTTELDALVDDVEEELEAAVTAARLAPDPPLEEALRDVYADA